MRKTFLGLAAIAAIATPLAFASSASAAVSVDKGIGHVDKGDIQSSSVLNLNNAKFQSAAEKGEITFTANVENIVDYKMTCLGSAEFGHRVIHQPVRYNVTATPMLNGDGSQILGFDFNGDARCADQRRDRLDGDHPVRGRRSAVEQRWRQPVQQRHHRRPAGDLRRQVLRPAEHPGRGPDPHRLTEQQHSSAPDPRVWGASLAVRGRPPALAPTGWRHSSVSVRDDRRIAPPNKLRTTVSLRLAMPQFLACLDGRRSARPQGCSGPPRPGLEKRAGWRAMVPNRTNSAIGSDLTANVRMLPYLSTSCG